MSRRADWPDQYPHGSTLLGLGPPLVAVYLMADVGSIAGGWIAGRPWSSNSLPRLEPAQLQ